MFKGIGIEESVRSKALSLILDLKRSRMYDGQTRGEPDD